MAQIIAPIPNPLSDPLIQANKDVVAAKQANPNAQFPTYSSGARSFIKVAGKPLGVCLDFRWQITIATSEIRSIDTNLPWDLVPGQISISATLNEIMDPRTSAEHQGLFHTIQSSMHQPYVEMEITDFTGASLFFARGMFVNLTGSVARGQLSSFSVGFVGVAYQHNVYQEFKPYSGFASLGSAVTQFGGAASQGTGGFL
jgi:hypothetical protein